MGPPWPSARSQRKPLPATPLHFCQCLAAWHKDALAWSTHTTLLRHDHDAQCRVLQQTRVLLQAVSRLGNSCADCSRILSETACGAL